MRRKGHVFCVRTFTDSKKYPVNRYESENIGYMKKVSLRKNRVSEILQSPNI